MKVGIGRNSGLPNFVPPRLVLEILNEACDALFKLKVLKDSEHEPFSIFKEIASISFVKIIPT